MEKQERLPLGVVLERREVDHPWVEHAWKAVAVIPGAGSLDPRGEWQVLGSGEGWVHYHAGTLSLELFRKETEGYKVNLSQDPPRVFIGLRAGEDMESAHDLVPFLVTACPYEAQDYMDSGEEQVEAVTMPDGVIGFVQAFIEQHHVDEPFYKRKRKPAETGDTSFGRRARIAPERRAKGRHE